MKNLSWKSIPIVLINVIAARACCRVYLVANKVWKYSYKSHKHVDTEIYCPGKTSALNPRTSEMYLMPWLHKAAATVSRVMFQTKQ